MKINRDNFNKKIIILIILILITTILSIIIVANIIIKPKSNKKNNDIKYIYKFDNDIKYIVNLYENNFYEEKYLEMDKQYTSKIVKNIELDFNSIYLNSNINDFSYYYDVTATLQAIYQENNNKIENTLWNKSFNIKTKEIVKEEKITTSNITDKIEIDYQYFNNLASEFKKEFRLDITSLLKINITLYYTININDEEIKDNIEMNITMPLLQSTFSIEKNYEPNINKIIYNTNNKNNMVIFLILKIIILLILTSFNIFLIIKLIKLNTNSKYLLKLNRIFRIYGNIIAETLIPPKIKNHNIIPIKTIDDLIDIEQELKIPIIYYEVKKGQESWFLIEHNKNLYKYILINQKDKE